MEILVTVLGLACLSWSVGEFVAAAARRDPVFQFGVVDAEGGRVVDVVVDRRHGGIDRRRGDRSERRITRL